MCIRDSGRRAPAAAARGSDQVAAASAVLLPRLDVWRLNDLLVAVNDTPTGQVVGRQLHDNPILGENTDVVLAHLAGNVGQHLVAVVQFDTEHRIWQGLDDATLNLDGAFFCHILQRFPSSDGWYG